MDFLFYLNLGQGLFWTLMNAENADFYFFSVNQRFSAS